MLPSQHMPSPGGFCSLRAHHSAIWSAFWGQTPCFPVQSPLDGCAHCVVNMEQHAGAQWAATAPCTKVKHSIDGQMKTEDLIPHALKTVDNSPIPALPAHRGLSWSFKPLCLQSVYSAAAAAQEACAWSTWAFPKSLTKYICGLALVEELITPDRPSAAPVRKGSAPARPAAPASSALLYLKPFFSNTNLFFRTRFGCVPWAGFHFLM